jgi:hypothetical protein
LALALLVARPNDVVALLREGAAYEHIRASVEGDDPNPEAVRNFGSVESQVLLHQASESLIRLFLADARCITRSSTDSRSFRARFRWRSRKTMISATHEF